MDATEITLPDAVAEALNAHAHAKRYNPYQMADTEKALARAIFDAIAAAATPVAAKQPAPEPRAPVMCPECNEADNWASMDTFTIDSPQRDGLTDRATLNVLTSDEVPGLGVITIFEGNAGTGIYLTPHQMDKVALDLIRRAAEIRGS
jgi:hypothetical protein